MRGGSPGTINTDALRLGYEEPLVNAIALSGGSTYGLSAATGVANAIRDAMTNPGSWENLALVFLLDDTVFVITSELYELSTRPGERFSLAKTP